MFEQYAAAADAFGLRRADIIAVHFVEHDGAVKSQFGAEAAKNTDQCRQRNITNGFKTPDGKPAEFKCEQILPGHNPDQIIDAHQRDRKDNEETVNPCVAPKCANQGKCYCCNQTDKKHWQGK